MTPKIPTTSSGCAIFDRLRKLCPNLSHFVYHSSDAQYIVYQSFLHTGGKCIAIVRKRDRFAYIRSKCTIQNSMTQIAAVSTTASSALELTTNARINHNLAYDYNIHDTFVGIVDTSVYLGNLYQDVTDEPSNEHPLYILHRLRPQMHGRILCQLSCTADTIIASTNTMSAFEWPPNYERHRQQAIFIRNFNNDNVDLVDNGNDVDDNCHDSLNTFDERKKLARLVQQLIFRRANEHLFERYHTTVNINVNLMTGTTGTNYGGNDSSIELTPKMLVLQFMEREPEFSRRIRVSDTNRFYINDAITGLWYRANMLQAREFVETQMDKTFANERYHLKFIELHMVKILQYFSQKIVDCNIEQRFDVSAPNVFAMANGVLDLEMKKFRSARPDEYCIMHCGWSYDANQSQRYIAKVQEFFATIFPVVEERHNALTIFSDFLNGRRISKRFIIVTDCRGGNNGKSCLFRVLGRMFGDAYCLASNAPLLQASFNRGINAHAAGLKDLRGRRLIWADEFKKSDQLDESFVKRVVSPDIKLMGRSCGSDAHFQFTSSFGIVAVCNKGKFPKFDTNDLALTDRMIVLELRSKFVRDINPNDDPPYTYSWQSDLCIDGWESATLDYLLTYYNHKQRQALDDLRLSRHFEESKQRFLDERRHTGDCNKTIIDGKFQINNNDSIEINKTLQKWLKTQLKPESNPLKWVNLASLKNTMRNSNEINIVQLSKCRRFSDMMKLTLRSCDIDVLPFFQWRDNQGLNHGKRNVIANFALNA